MFHSFQDDEVFPQLAHVIALIWHIELSDQRIADTIIVKVIFRFVGHFLAQIAAEAIQPVDHERLFEQVQIALQGFDIYAEVSAQFIVRNFTADLECQQFCFYELKRI